MLYYSTAKSRNKASDLHETVMYSIGRFYRCGKIDFIFGRKGIVLRILGNLCVALGLIYSFNAVVIINIFKDRSSCRLACCVDMMEKLCILDYTYRSFSNAVERQYITRAIFSKNDDSK